MFLQVFFFWGGGGGGGSLPSNKRETQWKRRGREGRNILWERLQNPVRRPIQNSGNMCQAMFILPQLQGMLFPESVLENQPNAVCRSDTWKVLLSCSLQQVSKPSVSLACKYVPKDTQKLQRCLQENERSLHAGTYRRQTHA